jgi:hypothetical protein
MEQTPCARCGNPATLFVNIDPPLVAKLREAGNTEEFPPKVCEKCFAEVAGSVARGSLLMVREKAKEQKKVMMWKSRVAIIKKARSLMKERAFSEAAVAYEKYLKILEVVLDSKAADLSPAHFKDSAKTSELTIVASVYWDLFRIYDTSPKYGERQALAGKKLAEFIRYTPIYPDIIRKAEAFQNSAKNPSVVRNFLQTATDGKGRCFIATAAFQYESQEVLILKKYRDQVLNQSAPGRIFIQFYYAVSPTIAKVLDSYEPLRRPTRWAVRKIANRLSQTSNSA